jgi:hypothetical protein
MRLAALFWLASLITLVVLIDQGSAGWDARVYWTAAQSLNRGGDPYAEGIAAQKAFHESGTHGAHFPMIYWYSPATLPLLRRIGQLPAWLAGCGFYLLITAAIALQFRAAWQMASISERKWLPLVLPATIYFPGLLYADVILSGNVVYIIYGVVLAAAVSGFKRGRWFWFYAAVLVASLVKAPLLTLVAFPLLVGRRQWIPAASTGVLGVALFAMQNWLWPQLFAEYLYVLRMQFAWDHDFGFSPAGMLGQSMAQMGTPFITPCEIFYLCYAVVLTLILVAAAHRAHADEEAHRLWIPVALVGTFLLNPRIKEYDIAAISIPMLLVLTRLFPRTLNTSVRAMDWRGATQSGVLPLAESARRQPMLAFLGGLGWFLLLNFVASKDSWWNSTELTVLLATTGAGLWTIFRTTSAAAVPRFIPVLHPLPAPLAAFQNRDPVS